MARPRTFVSIDKQCPHCHKWWYADAWYAVNKQKYCSRECRSKATGEKRRVKRVIRSCKKCGKEMRVLPCLQKTKWFCSYACGNSYNNQGNRNTAWKGGDVLGKSWKRKTRERDNFTCQFPQCGVQSKSKSTHAHHKIPRSIGGEDTLNNLITLCSKHHREMERRLFKALIERHPETTQDIVSGLYSW